MRRILSPVVLLFACISFAADMPPNSHPNIFGNGWDCDRGYYKSGQGCKKVIVPENASINVYGNSWACNRGYYKSGQGCKKVIVPENASINVYGNSWACNRGYYKSGQGCKKVIVPENASINVYGSGWSCNSGFKKAGSSCMPMTQEEIKKRKALEAAVVAEMQRRRAQGVSSNDCEMEYKTNAEVCVEITGGDLDCSESYGGGFYRDCDATLSYEVETNYSGGAYLDVEVECTLEIEYKGWQTYSTQSDSSSQDESYNLYAHGSDRDSMNFNFSFSSYKEITSVKISSAECEIDSVNLY